MLKQIVNNQLTDKNTTHSYLEVYENLFSSIKDTAKNVLEIGICEGGSILLWRDFFQKATIYGLDIEESRNINDTTRIKTYQGNAYDDEFVSSKFSDVKFDVVIDDGPHTLQSMLDFVRLYRPLLSDKGYLIIEDVQAYDWTKTIIDSFPEEEKSKVYIEDRRNVKGRYDDIMIIYKK